jgi:hypothetical protein
MDRMDKPETSEPELLVAVAKTIGYRIEAGFVRETHREASYNAA